MTEHLTQGVLNQFADGELSAEQVAGVNEHLAGCRVCTTHALSQMVLKSATARAGRRYAMPNGLRERVLQRASDQVPGDVGTQSVVVAGSGRRRAFGGWAAVAAMLDVAKRLDRGVIVTVFPDGAEKYLSEKFWTIDD